MSPLSLYDFAISRYADCSSSGIPVKLPPKKAISTVLIEGFDFMDERLRSMVLTVSSRVGGAVRAVIAF